MVLLEICIDTFDSARAASVGGADRVEVCSSLALGGLTPSIGLLKQVKSKLPNLPAYCMLRPRSGDFVYSEEEMETVLLDLEELKRRGADGFVFGALNPDGSLEKDTCKAVIRASAPLPVTLHRAIDFAADWKCTLKTAIEIGFRSVLSSGQRASAINGLETLREMVNSYPGITVLAGSGVHPGNVSQIVERIPSIGGIHGSASLTVASKLEYVPGNFRMGPNDDSGSTKATSVDLVAKLAEHVRNC